MICEACGKNTATTYIKTIINGALTEHHLCTECAAKSGYPHLFSSKDFDNILGAFSFGLPVKEKADKCGNCGKSLEEITKSGKIGCAKCYIHFREHLMPAIKKIHGTARHKPMQAEQTALSVTNNESRLAPLKSRIEILKKELEKAVSTQNFELAATLRDEIKNLEGGYSDEMV